MTLAVIGTSLKIGGGKSILNDVVENLLQDRRGFDSIIVFSGCQLDIVVPSTSNISIVYLPTSGLKRILFDLYYLNYFTKNNNIKFKTFP